MKYTNIGSISSSQQILASLLQTNTNINPKTGIRYGVALLNSLAEWVFDEFFYGGTDLTYQAAKQDAEQSGEYLDTQGDFDEDAFNDGYQAEESEYELETDGMKLGLSYLGGAANVWVFESPHLVDCATCSPCCPNAGDLGTNRVEGSTTYSLPSDWFDSAE